MVINDKINKKGNNLMTNEKLTELLEKKGKSIFNVAEEIGIPYTTLRDILKKGILLTRVDKALLIANYLNLKIDNLLNDDKYINIEMKKNEIINKLDKFNNVELNELSVIIDKIIKIKENQ